MLQQLEKGQVKRSNSGFALPQQRPTLVRKGEKLLAVFSAYLKLKGDTDDSCEESYDPTLFCYDLETMKLIWQIPKAIAIISLTEQGIARVAKFNDRKIEGIDTMQWTEDDADKSVKMIPTTERTKVSLTARFSSALTVYEHDDRITCVLHEHSSKTYDLKSGKLIYYIEGSVHFITTDNRSYIQQLQP